MQLDNSGISIDSFDVKMRIPSEVFVTYPGMQVGKLIIDNGPNTVKLLLRKVDQAKRLRKSAIKVRNKLGPQHNVPPELFQLLAELDTL